MKFIRTALFTLTAFTALTALPAMATGSVKGALQENRAENLLPQCIKAMKKNTRLDHSYIKNTMRFAKADRAGVFVVKLTARVKKPTGGVRREAVSCGFNQNNRLVALKVGNNKIK